MGSGPSGRTSGSPWLKPRRVGSWGVPTWSCVYRSQRLLGALDAVFDLLERAVAVVRLIDLVPRKERVRQAVERRRELRVVAQQDVLHLRVRDPADAGL